MLKVPQMKVSDITCLLCGSRLKLGINSVIAGENKGKCPACDESFVIKVTDEEMEEFLIAEEEIPLK